VRQIGNRAKVDVKRRNCEWSAALDAARDRFNDGLFSVIEAPRRLAAEEKLVMVVGGAVYLTMDVLERHIRFEHGDDARSPQKVMLLERLFGFTQGEMRAFLRFVTGSEVLPIGELDGLQSRITAAQRLTDAGEVDDALPTVSACAHYFKLPPDSCKEVTRHKIMSAIAEGQGFHFS
jgi:hypothetical protein